MIQKASIGIGDHSKREKRRVVTHFGVRKNNLYYWGITGAAFEIEQEPGQTDWGTTVQYRSPQQEREYFKMRHYIHDLRVRYASVSVQRAFSTSLAQDSQ